MKKRAFSMVGLLSVLALLMSGCGTPEQEKEPVVQEQQTEQTGILGKMFVDTACVHSIFEYTGQ